MVQNEVLIYAELPHGEVVPGKHLKKETSEFDVDSVELNGGFVLKVHAISLDPYLKGRMRAPEVKSYSPPLEVGKPLETLGAGEVVRSDNPDVKVSFTELSFEAQRQTHVSLIIAGRSNLARTHRRRQLRRRLWNWTQEGTSSRKRRTITMD